MDATFLSVIPWYSQNMQYKTRTDMCAVAIEAIAYVSAGVHEILNYLSFAQISW